MMDRLYCVFYWSLIFMPCVFCLVRRFVRHCGFGTLLRTLYWRAVASCSNGSARKTLQRRPPVVWISSSSHLKKLVCFIAGTITLYLVYHVMMNSNEMTGGVVAAERLLCAQIIFRHGSRTPLHQLPSPTCENQRKRNTDSDYYGFNNVGYGSEIFHPFAPSELIKVRLNKLNGNATMSQQDYFKSIGVDPDRRLQGGAPYGYLTSYGRKQLYTLGQKISDRLCAIPEFAKAFIEGNNVRVQSSFVHRTIDSAQSFISGMYSKCNSQMLASKSKMDAPNEFPIHVDSFEKDLVFPNFLAAPILSKDYLQIYNSLSDSVSSKKLRNEFLTDIGNKDYTLGLLELTDEVLCREALKLPVSKHMLNWNKRMSDLLTTEFNLIYGHGLSHNDFVKVTVGRLLDAMIKNFNHHAKNKDNNQAPFLQVYSSHDSTLHCLKVALEADHSQWPPFASYILMEMYDGPNGPFLKFTFNDQEMHPFGIEKWTLEEFQGRIKPLLCTNDELMDLNERLKPVVNSFKK